MTGVRDNRVKNSEIQAYFSEAKGQELLIMDVIMASKKSAWRVTYCLIVLTLLAFGIAYKKMSDPAPAPLVLRVDNSTGSVDVVTGETVGSISEEEAKDIFQLNAYVLHREAYDYATIQTDWDSIELHSNATTWADYSAYIDGPKGLLTTVADAYKIRVSVTTIVPNVEQSQAVVRFSTWREYPNGRKTDPVPMVATVAYAYERLMLTPVQRRLNPWGFQMISYRVDPETVRTR